MKIKISLIDDDGKIYEDEIEFKTKEHQNDQVELSLDESPQDDPLQTLAYSCGVGRKELKEVIDYVNNEFIFIGNVNEPDFNKKRAKICQYILTAWMKGNGIEWIDSVVLVESLRKLGISSTNMNRSINPKDGIFRTRGLKKNMQYSLTIPGWKNGLEMLKAEAEKAID